MCADCRRVLLRGAECLPHRGVLCRTLFGAGAAVDRVAGASGVVADLLDLEAFLASLLADAHHALRDERVALAVLSEDCLGSTPVCGERVKGRFFLDRAAGL